MKDVGTGAVRSHVEFLDNRVIFDTLAHFFRPFTLFTSGVTF